MGTAVDRSLIEDLFREPIDSVGQISGGCISHAFKVTLQSQKTYFYKTLNSDTDLFEKEANGLREIAKSKTISVPEVYQVGQNYLLLEYVSPKNPDTQDFIQLGKSLAKLHQTNASFYGFYEDNYIGSNPQKNTTKDKTLSWSEFFFENRLLYQFKLMEKNYLMTEDFKKKFFAIEKNIDSILKGGDESPCLIHGDLWSGNFLISDTGIPYLIDPAVYYGHREAELAMTSLFGGFPQEFYQSYENEFPLKEGYQSRRPLYQLYHVMNHINLFGKGYYDQSMELLNFYAR